MNYNDHIQSAYSSSRSRTQTPRWSYSKEDFEAAVAEGFREGPEIEATRVFLFESFSESKLVDEVILDDESNLLAFSAVAWMIEGGSTFEYVESMRENWAKWGSLSVGQVRGLLNCLRAEVLRDPDNQPFRDPALKPIVEILATAKANGLKKPRLHFDVADQHVIVKEAGGRNVGSFYVTGRYEDDLYFGKFDGQGEPDVKLAGSVVYAALVEFAADPKGYATRAGRDTIRCMFCGTELDTTESRTVGYGPICAGRFGLPWGIDA